MITIEETYDCVIEVKSGVENVEIKRAIRARIIVEPKKETNPQPINNTR